jgi:hypothetical protein
LESVNCTRRRFTKALISVAGAASLHEHRVFAQSEGLVDEQGLRFLRDLAIRTIAKCRTTVTIDGQVFPAYLPSGSRQYPAFWTRDASWIIASGLLETPDIESMVEVLARTQNGAACRKLKHGLEVPAWAVADHVLCDNGGAVFFPGTYSAGDDQGKGRYGKRASQDACYMFIELAYQWHEQSGSTALLAKEIAGVSLLERLEHAFVSPECDAETQLAFTSVDSRAVAFSDAIVKTGFLLEGSILRWRAARRLARITAAMNLPDRSANYTAIAEQIQAHLPRKLWQTTSPNEGWLLSASEIGRKLCVRGTSFALALGILDQPHAERASRALVAATTPPALHAVPTRGQITYQGHIRHLPWGQYWDDTPMRKETYQNGGYWGMFSGWFVRGLAITDPELARQTAEVFLAHMRRYSFFDGEDETQRGAPWEWIHPNGKRVGPLYAATATLSYRGFRNGFRV